MSNLKWQKGKTLLKMEDMKLCASSFSVVSYKFFSLVKVILVHASGIIQLSSMLF